jgi:hypothetical protein
MIYTYIKLSIPDLDNMEWAILASSIAETYQYFRWDESDTLLKVHLSRELTEEEKLVLDNVVA